MTNHTALETRGNKAQAAELALIEGDLSKLSEAERVNYYLQVCQSLNLNPYTKPFQYIVLNGKMVLYAKKDCTEQLRAHRNITVDRLERSFEEGLVIVTTYLRTPAGRIDSAIGAVPIEGLKGEARANALMKCETKSKRRATLSICGLGMLDETEIETIPGAQVIEQPTPQHTLPAAEDTDLEPLRQEIEGYRTTDPEGVRLVEHKYGPIPAWRRDTLVKAQAWFKERSEVAPQAEEEEADDDEQDDDEEYETVINDISAFLTVVDKRNGNTTVEDIVPMQTMLAACQKLRAWPDEVPARQIASGSALLTALRLRVAAEQGEQPVMGVLTSTGALA